MQKNGVLDSDWKDDSEQIFYTNTFIQLLRVLLCTRFFFWKQM